MILTGVTKEDVVIVPTLTFIEAVNSVKYFGESLIFMNYDGLLCVDAKKPE